jgi:hypothetical protein
MLLLLLFLLGGMILGFAVAAWINHSNGVRRRAARQVGQPVRAEGSVPSARRSAKD